ncbi:hypothetical protein Hypma_006948 [Hypsizygus marmoreus]|uniref:Uncharacterized protein n=1 Tax=Hypsizygus marmoreus TaxID=39966 RepID=A0A369JW57_HYPMA|nr:hypothetical protein Hypma_006948 [Hypsizygus marmoreus]
MASARNQEEEEFAEYLLPFVKITSEENAQEDFLRALLVVWFDRFPLQMTGAEEFAAHWNFMQRRDQTSGSFENVLHRFSSLELRDSE